MDENNMVNNNSTNTTFEFISTASIIHSSDSYFDN